MSVSIREATEADLPRLVALLAQLSSDPSAEALDAPASDAYVAAFAAIRGDPRQKLFVLEADGGVVATAVLLVVPNLSHHGTPYAIIENVVVDDLQRGQGLGETLLRHTIEEARRAGCYKITLTSAKRRAGAHSFYERLGFRAASEGFRLDL